VTWKFNLGRLTTQKRQVLVSALIGENLLQRFGRTKDGIPNDKNWQKRAGPGTHDVGKSAGLPTV
jgi:hypothetical protein